MLSDFTQRGVVSLQQGVAILDGFLDDVQIVLIDRGQHQDGWIVGTKVY